MIFINHKHLHVADFLKPSLYIDHKMSYIYVYWVNQNQVYVQMHENCSKYCFKEYRVRVFQTYDFLLFIFSRSTGCKKSARSIGCKRVRLLDSIKILIPVTNYVT